MINLKRQIIDFQGEIEQKDAELDFLKKKMKNTKINELEIELEITKAHMSSLKSFIDA